MYRLAVAIKESVPVSYPMLFDTFPRDTLTHYYFKVPHFLGHGKAPIFACSPMSRMHENSIPISHPVKRLDDQAKPVRRVQSKDHSTVGKRPSARCRLLHVNVSCLVRPSGRRSLHPIRRVMHRIRHTSG